MTFRIALAAVCLLAACSPPAPERAATAPAPSLESMSPREALLDCAGAVTAASGLDARAREPTLGTPAEDLYWTLLALMDKEPGLFGEAGRNAAADSRDAWASRPAAERDDRAQQCATRFGGSN